jgi:hypothetical protein
MAYKNVEKGSAWNFEEKGEFEGNYLGFEENVGPNNSMLYNFKSLDGEAVAVWGSTVLDGKMKHIEPGMRVKIISLGTKKSPKGNTYKDFAVSVWYDEDAA